MTLDRLAEIEALLAAATPGPWSATVTKDDATGEYHDPNVPPVLWEWEIGTEDEVVLNGIGYGRSDCDLTVNVAFVAAAPTVVAELLAEVRRLQVQNVSLTRVAIRGEAARAELEPGW